MNVPIILWRRCQRASIFSVIGIFLSGMTAVNLHSQTLPRIATPIVEAFLSHQWALTLYDDGSGRLVCGASDIIEVDAGTFVVEKTLEEFGDAVSVAQSWREFAAVPDKASRGRDSAFSVTVVGSGGIPSLSGTAVFTPEVKSYCDQLLAGALSERMQKFTNRHPVFSEKLMTSLRNWTNSPQYRARSARPVDGQSSRISNQTVPQGSQLSSIPGRIALKSDQATRPLGPSDQSEGAPPAEVSHAKFQFTIRGWLVIGLLAIAAFLTYRFIKLRLGS